MELKQTRHISTNLEELNDKIARILKAPTSSDVMTRTNVNVDAMTRPELEAFAEEGGLGACVSKIDVLADTPNDLMYLQGERIIVLKHVQNDIYLGYCEGVIGNFNAENVHFVELDPRVLESLDADYISDIMTAEDYYSSNRNSNSSSNHFQHFQHIPISYDQTPTQYAKEKASLDSIGSTATTSSISLRNSNCKIINNNSAFQSPHSSHISTVSHYNNSSLEDQLVTDYSHLSYPNQEDPYDTSALNIDYSDEEEMAHFNVDIKPAIIPSATNTTPINNASSRDNNTSKTTVQGSAAAAATAKLTTVKATGTSERQQTSDLTLDEYGFIIPNGQRAKSISRNSSTNSARQQLSKTAMHKSMKDYRETELKWLSIVSKLDAGNVKRDAKLKKLVRHGIPGSVRARVWQFLAGSATSSNSDENSKWIKQLLNRPRTPIYDVIERDIARCYPDHVQFLDELGQGQKDLSQLLKAYAQYNPELEYCQGMGRLAGLMLMHMSLEDAFALFVVTIDRYMNGYFTPSLSQLRIDAYIIGQLLRDHQPKLAHHLEKNDVLPVMYIAQWFLTAFTMTLPWESVLRVWDAFYFEGIKVFYRVSLAILELCKEHLLTACPSNSELLAFLLHIPHEYLEPQMLLDTAFKINLSKTDIKKYAKKAGTAGTESGTFGLPFEQGIKNLQVGGTSGLHVNGSGLKPFQNSLNFKRKL